LINLDVISNTTVPIAMFVGDHDTVADPTDAQILAKQLGGKTVIEYMLVKDFNHYSFNLFHPDNEDAEEYLQRMVYWVHAKNPLPQYQSPE
jgi:alpha-beta hydrolase superfamily lysophospholipase